MQVHPEEDQPRELGDSFLLPIRSKLLQAVRSATPERQDINKLFVAKVEAIDFGDREESFAANPAYGIITGSWWAAEALWCVSFAYATWGPILEAAITERRREAVICGSSCGKIAAGLIAFTRRSLESGTRQAWLHTNVAWPYVDDGTIQDSTDDVLQTVIRAEEIFLGALGWIMLHEFAHLDRGHGKGVTLVEEREADEQATRWLFELAPFGDAAIRADGLASAQLYMWMRQTLSGSHDGDHPPVGERIQSALKTADLHRNAWSTCTLAAMAELLFQTEGVTMPGSLGSDFPTCEDYLLDVIRAMQR